MPRVAVLAYDGVIPFDLSVPIEVFGRAGGGTAYEVLVCAATDQVRAGPLGISAPHDLGALAGADTVVVPGCADCSSPTSRPSPTATDSSRCWPG